MPAPKNKYVVELVIETDLKLTKKRVRQIVADELENARSDGIIEGYRVRSVDKD